MMHVFNAKKYVIYTQSNSRIWSMNHDEKLLLKLIKAGSYTVLNLHFVFLRTVPSLLIRKDFQELHRINMILKK